MSPPRRTLEGLAEMRRRRVRRRQLQWKRRRGRHANVSADSVTSVRAHRVRTHLTRCLGAREVSTLRSLPPLLATDAQMAPFVGSATGSGKMLRAHGYARRDSATRVGVRRTYTMTPSSAALQPACSRLRRTLDRVARLADGVAACGELRGRRAHGRRWLSGYLVRPPAAPQGALRRSGSPADPTASIGVLLAVSAAELAPPLKTWPSFDAEGVGIAFWRLAEAFVLMNGRRGQRGDEIGQTRTMVLRWCRRERAPSGGPPSGREKV